MLKEALNFAKLGWAVFPLYEPISVQKCSCSKGDACHNNGKHPRTEHGVDDATTDVTKITEWWTKWPLASIGIAAGPKSNLGIIDLDGAVGLESSTKLGLYSPVTVVTGDGRHLYFKWTDGIKNSVKTLAPGVDVRAEGGYVVAPPSAHSSGRRYSFIRPLVGLNLLPEFPVALLKAQESTSEKKQPGWISESLEKMTNGNIDITLFSVCSRLRADGYTPEDAKVLLQPHADRVGATPGHLDEKIRNVWSRYEPNVRPERSRPSGNEPQKALTLRTFANSKEDYARRKALRSGPTEFRTGYKKLDSLTGGLHRQELLTVAARTGVGKTNWLLGATKTLCHDNKTVLMFSTEMSYDNIWDRYIETLEPGESFDSHKFILCDDFKPDIQRIEETIRSVNPDVFIFDHINIMGDDHPLLSNFMYGLKEKARLFNIPGIVAAQLNRTADWTDPQTHETVIPRLSMIKGSGTIEEASAQVLLLSEQQVGPDHNELVGNLDKNRYGEKGLIYFLLKKNPYVMVEDEQQ